MDESEDEESSKLIEEAYKQLEAFRHAPKNVKSFQEILALCNSIRNESPSSDVLVGFLTILTHFLLSVFVRSLQLHSNWMLRIRARQFSGLH